MPCQRSTIFKKHNKPHEIKIIDSEGMEDATPSLVNQRNLQGDKTDESGVENFNEFFDKLARMHQNKEITKEEFIEKLNMRTRVAHIVYEAQAEMLNMLSP